MENVLDCKLSCNTAGEVGYEVGDQWTSCNFDYLWHYYPSSYPVYIENKDKVSQAFKIVSKMLEKKIIEKELTVKDFIGLVNTIADII